MKYLPASLYVIGVVVATLIGLYITKKPDCLLALVFLTLIGRAMPRA